MKPFKIEFYMVSSIWQEINTGKRLEQYNLCDFNENLFVTVFLFA